jgi:hypothetical protein
MARVLAQFATPNHEDHVKFIALSIHQFCCIYPLDDSRWKRKHQVTVKDDSIRPTTKKKKKKEEDETAP